MPRPPAPARLYDALMRPRTRCIPLPLVGRGWGGGPSADHRTTPTPALRHSRCFASALFARTTAAEGRLCPPHKGGGRAELAARADSISPLSGYAGRTRVVRP